MISYGEARDRFQAHFVRFANKGELKYIGGRTFKADGLELISGRIINNALITYEDDQTTVVDLDTNEIMEFII